MNYYDHKNNVVISSFSESGEVITGYMPGYDSFDASSLEEAIGEMILNMMQEYEEISVTISCKREDNNDVVFEFEEYQVFEN